MAGLPRRTCSQWLGAAAWVGAEGPEDPGGSQQKGQNGPREGWRARVQAERWEDWGGGADTPEGLAPLRAASLLSQPQAEVTLGGTVGQRHREVGDTNCPQCEHGSCLRSGAVLCSHLFNRYCDQWMHYKLSLRA